MRFNKCTVTETWVTVPVKEWKTVTTSQLTELYNTETIELFHSHIASEGLSYHESLLLCLFNPISMIHCTSVIQYRPQCIKSIKYS